MKEFDFNTVKSLHIDDIYLLVKPFSDLGRKAKKNFKTFVPGEENKLTAYYQRLAILIDTIIKNNGFLKNTISILSHFEDISSSIKAGTKRSYEMHELFEIKHFIYHYTSLVHKLQSIDILPKRDFSRIFALLDKDGQNSPTFYLSNDYSKLFSSLKSELTDIERRMDNIFFDYREQIKSKMKIAKLEDTVTLSRLKKDEIDRLIDSKYFYVDDENFANITLKIRKPAEVLDLELKASEIKQSLEKEAIRIRATLTAKIIKKKHDFLAALEEVGDFDLLLAKAIFARAYHCTIPIIQSGKTAVHIELGETFNLFLQSELSKMAIPYQKIDIKITDKVTIITGSNMGGKTSILKTIGQVVCMTSLGLPLPAESASLRLFDNVFYSGTIATEDRADLSSFGYEVFTLQNVINAPGRNLFLLDEFGKGTNPTEGQALFHSVIQYFTKYNDILIATTHYTPPKDLKDFTHLQMIGLQEDFIKELKSNHSLDHLQKIKLIHKYMNYQPVKVQGHESIPQSALHIAELLGLEKDILDGAKRAVKGE